MMDVETKYIISPHDICDSCNGQSGPKFSLNALRGISDAHRNNVIPTGVDLQTRLDAIRDAQIDLDGLGIEISRLKETLNILEQRQIELNDFKQREMSLFAPIRSLPDDVLQKLFMTCQEELGEESQPGYIQYNDPNTFVRTVTQVSNYWRNTALSMPFLWSRVSFNDDKKNDSPMSTSPGEFLERCMVLSGWVPLSIDFGSCAFTSKTFSDRCLKELAKSAHRWEHFTASGRFCETIKLHIIMKYVPEETVFHSLKTLGPVESSQPITLYSTPALTHLTVDHDSYSPSTIAFPSAPLLTSIKTTGLSSPQKALPDFPWSQITHYQCDEYYNDSVTFPTFLNSMPKLLSLTMELTNENVISTYVRLPRLEALTFDFITQRGIYRDVANEPLKRLTTPSLKDLNVKGECDSNVILDLLTRSGCNIEKLSLNANTLMGEKWNDHDDLVGGVKHLVVCWDDRRGGKHATTLKYLARKIIFPRLEVLELEFRNGLPEGKPFPIDDFKALVTSRLPSKNKRSVKTVADLKSVTLTCPLDKHERNALTRFSTSAVVRQAKANITLHIEKRADDLD